MTTATAPSPHDRWLAARATQTELLNRSTELRTRLVARQTATRLVQQRPASSRGHEDYARKLLARITGLKVQLEAVRANRTVSRAVVEAIDQQVLVTSHLTQVSRTTPDQLSPRQRSIADLLERRDDLSLRLLNLSKAARATSLERVKLRRTLHALIRENAASVALLKARRTPPLLDSAEANALLSTLPPRLQQYYSDLSDELVVTSAELIRLNHIFQKLVAELGLPVQTYLPAGPAASGAAPPLSANGRCRSGSATRHHQPGSKLTPQRLLALLMLAGRSPEEDFDRASSSSYALLSDAGFFSALGDSDTSQDTKSGGDGARWPEEVRREMSKWEAERGEKDPWEVYKRRLELRDSIVKEDEDVEMKLEEHVAE